jgi:hypothetical protein
MDEKAPSMDQNEPSMAEKEPSMDQNEPSMAEKNHRWVKT